MKKFLNNHYSKKIISLEDLKKVLGKRIKIKVEKNKILKLKNIY